MSATDVSYLRDGMRGGERDPMVSKELADSIIYVSLKGLLIPEGVNAHTVEGLAVPPHLPLASRIVTVSAMGKHVCLVVNLVLMRSLT